MSDEADKPAETAAPRGGFGDFLRSETVSGMVLLVAAAVALVLANSPLSGFYESVRDFEIGPESLGLHLSIGDWAKDALLAIFFFVVGIELKREFVVGELSNPRAAALPVIAALGGMVTPALLSLLVSWGAPGSGSAWAVPMATDIAFAVGVLAVAGSRLPTSARIFLLSLAVVDDLGAIAVIAVLFTSGLSLLALAAAAAFCAVYWFCQRRRITSPLIYIPLAIATWIAVHEAGVHATIAGVLLGLLTRVRADKDEEHSPVDRLEHRLRPWSAGFALPVFALFAAGVPIGGDALAAIAEDRVALSIIVGLVLGKLIGITGFSWLAVKLGIAKAPRGLRWADVSAMALLGGIGFTVALLMAELALTDAQSERAKAAVLIASGVAAVLSIIVLRLRVRYYRRLGQDQATTAMNTAGDDLG
ncbi:Na+/H+ antiporter NhaA [Actinoalloteichus hymeniacidonis]|uniref:Na(+)/H(+) antiporter NhaA n=1 Tax=Actinoalloteichus hymeniacidonis TaxID=340345 RepID=A0AAC9HL09_9PSEU|nr:Na+/H+ antiporter NhaA [Actinoalloteichus hymeniacidonis]AOS61106.1 sodium/proton antiporter, NhaA family [Actinoalloteichus hymeniacidonis]MBB5910893.1 NhaA family Na+:H+ antiporter [Actinoalloteichus hymeniacidonis]